jgi:hypothetical protein
MFPAEPRPQCANPQDGFASAGASPYQGPGRARLLSSRPREQALTVEPSGCVWLIWRFALPLRRPTRPSAPGIPGGLRLAGLAWMLLVAVLAVSSGSASPFLEGHGMANASAGVRIGEDRVLVGSDEHNALQLYRAATGGEPLATFEASRWLGFGPRHGEADFEGAARIGDVAYWIGSHSRNKDGKPRPERHCLLALRLANETNDLQVIPVGPAVTTLLEQLAQAPTLAAFHLSEAARLPPEATGGLNIEGLSATPEGGLLIGFRNPIPDDLALLVPLLNPAELVAGRAARFGEAIRLDLGGRGIRDIAWTGREYFLIGGSPGNGGKSRLFRWKGPGHSPRELKVSLLKDLNPEGIVVFGTPEKPRLLILSDDGNHDQNQTPNIAKRTFRMLWVRP